MNDLSEEWKALEKELAQPAPAKVKGQESFDVDTACRDAKPPTRREAVRKAVAMKLQKGRKNG